MAQFTKVAHTADLASGAAKCVEVAGKKIALFNLQGSFYAIDDTCTHLALTERAAAVRAGGGRGGRGVGARRSRR